MHALFKKINFFASLFLVLFYLSLISVSASYAQERKLPADTTIVSTDEVTINGQKVPYEVTIGTMPVYGEDGKADAAMQYTYYKRTDVKDKENRPIFISFNGGPGTGSLWMHLGYTSPKRLKISDEGYPIQPYGVVDNHHSIIDVADIVYVNPVSTGFSRILNDGKKEDFFGVNEDLKYLADWIDTFISRQGRWRSPKYLIGESYGTPRVSGLAGELSSRHWINLNGVVLVSPTGLGLTPSGASARSSVFKLPYYTATAWYHNQLPQDLQSKELEDILPEVEDFTINEFLPAVSYGGFIQDDLKESIAKKVARYSGLTEDFVLNYNLTVPASAYWKELLRNDGFTVGRLDSRYKGIDKMNAGERPDYAAELRSWEQSFAPAINDYLQEDLGFKTDLKYYIWGPVHPWNRDNNHTGDMLRQAMAENPALHVLMQGGYYDGATDYFSAKYTLWNLDPSGRMQGRLQFKGYRSGHMVYIRKKIMIKATDDLRQFVLDTLPKEGVPAQY